MLLLSSSLSIWAIGYGRQKMIFFVVLSRHDHLAMHTVQPFLARLLSHEGRKAWLITLGVTQDQMQVRSCIFIVQYCARATYQSIFWHHPVDCPSKFSFGTAVPKCVPILEQCSWKWLFYGTYCPIFLMI